MSPAERERRHRARLAQIDQVQVVSGRGDTTRLDHEATLFERARMLSDELASHEATEEGLAAFERLLERAESRKTPYTPELTQFLRAVWDHQSLPMRLLRGVDAPVARDMVAVLQAYSLARVELAENVKGGAHRIARVLRRRAEAPPQAAV